LFSRLMTEAAAKEMMPAFRWWLAFGVHAPKLQKVAVSHVGTSYICSGLRTKLKYLRLHPHEEAQSTALQMSKLVILDVHCKLRILK